MGWVFYLFYYCYVSYGCQLYCIAYLLIVLFYLIRVVLYLQQQCKYFIYIFIFLYITIDQQVLINTESNLLYLFISNSLFTLCLLFQKFIKLGCIFIILTIINIKILLSFHYLTIPNLTTLLIDNLDNQTMTLHHNQSSHTVCSILINTPITFALQSLWALLLEENQWTQGSTITKTSTQKISRTLTTPEINVKQTITKLITHKKITFINQSGNLNGYYSYLLEQNNKGEVILTYQSSARRNSLTWPPKFAVQQELIWLKNTLQQRLHANNSKKGLLCC